MKDKEAIRALTVSEWWPRLVAELERQAISIVKSASTPEEMLTAKGWLHAFDWVARLDQQKEKKRD